MLSFGPEVCQDFAQAASREWLETNGLGGYASSTIVGCNTRRYHGLLTAALPPPWGRTLLFSKLEETLAIGDEEFDLSSNQYPGAVHPQGFRSQTGFRLDPFPTSLHEVSAAAGLVRLEKTIFMPQLRSAVVVRYRLLAAPATVTLLVRPLVTCRGHHTLMRENLRFQTGVRVSGGRDRIALTPYPGSPTLHLWHPGSYFEVWGDWYRNLEYPRELERGLDFQEDLYSPGFFGRQLDDGACCWFLAATDPIDEDPAALEAAESRRRARPCQTWPGAPELVQRLTEAADSFLVVRRLAEEEEEPQQPQHTIIAGYHWFEDWGRDTMIALPGLTLVTGRHDLARSILCAFAAQVSQGMLPNRFPESGTTPDYNTVDAALWMFHAVHKFLEYTGDLDFVREHLLPALREIIAWYRRGTRYGIHMDDDGLISAGEPGSQLTWMDAKVGDWVVTPRHGKPVEINALWYGALRLMQQLDGRDYGRLAAQVRRSFQPTFWYPEGGYLYDVITPEGPDASLRPNQVFAVSLPDSLGGASWASLLPREKQRRVVEVIERELLTPVGLRTLSPGDPRYCGHYGGDQRARDAAYHQGTVWPWLLGPFISAYFKVNGRQEPARLRAKELLHPFLGHLQQAGLGTVSEIFEGDFPHPPRGCISQAWSVAELLRAAVEEAQLHLDSRGRALQSG
jgi:predicted glycogen debranching enzyme